mgnify:CR=1 FL=1
MPAKEIDAARAELAAAIAEPHSALTELAHAVTANEELLRKSLFGQPRFAEVLIGEDEGEPVAFALFFHNYSTFLAKPGLYLEDLFVKPEARGRGHGRAMQSLGCPIRVDGERSSSDRGAPLLGAHTAAIAKEFGL